MATVNGEKNVIIISIFENFSQLNTKKIMNYGKASHKICIIYQYLGILTIAKYYWMLLKMVYIYSLYQNSDWINVNITPKIITLYINSNELYMLKFNQLMFCSVLFYNISLSVSKCIEMQVQPLEIFCSYYEQTIKHQAFIFDISNSL